MYLMSLQDKVMMDRLVSLGYGDEKMECVRRVAFGISLRSSAVAYEDFVTIVGGQYAFDFYAAILYLPILVLP